MLSVLVLGLLLGLQHALDADHLAAVASLSAQKNRLRDAARQGAAWGVGHSLTLLLLGGSVLLIGIKIGPQLALALELVVGIMLVGLGSHVLLRMWRQRVHFHVHRHGEATHIHAHAHTPEVKHTAAAHHHEHPAKIPLRPLLVGMTHGLAGSAALMVLVLGSVQSPWLGLLYILIFGIGSVVGMTALAVVISLPLRWSADRLEWAYHGLLGMLGMLTIGLGVLLINETGSLLLAGFAGA
jgi:ABC-type nickel/cobalt efflux system permease component RcnA